MQEKEIDKKQEQNLLSKFCNLLEIFEITEQELLLASLLSAWTFLYWNMEVLLELLIIEIIFLQSKFWTNVEIFSILLNSYVYFSKVYSCQVLGGGMVQTAFLLSRRCSLATPAFSAFLLRCQFWPRQLFLFKTKLIICERVAGSKSLKILAMPRREGVLTLPIFLWILQFEYLWKYWHF